MSKAEPHISEFQPKAGGGGMRTEARVPDFADDIPRPAYLAHVVLNTQNVRGMSEWYRTVLGAQSTFSASGFEAVDEGGEEHSFDAEFLTFDGEHHRIAFTNVGGAGAGAASVTRNFDHIGFTYASISDLVKTYSRLKALGILPSITIHHGGTVSNYYVDPDGNRVELQVDAFPTANALNDWFAKGAFRENPIGRTFDFDVLVNRFEAGDDREYLRSVDGFVADYCAGHFNPVPA